MQKGNETFMAKQHIVKVSFFDVSTSIYSYLAFNLEKKPNLIIAIYNLNKFFLFK
jgi:hypothetical protein